MTISIQLDPEPDTGKKIAETHANLEDEQVAQVSIAFQTRNSAAPATIRTPPSATTTTFLRLSAPASDERATGDSREQHAASTEISFLIK